MDKDLSIINHFNLTPHPEGGWFRRTYTCSDSVSLKRGDRNCASSILYFLKKLNLKNKVLPEPIIDYEGLVELKKDYLSLLKLVMMIKKYIMKI